MPPIRNIMIKFNYTNDEYQKTVASTPPDILFSENFQKMNFHLKKAFNDFVKENYKEVDKVNEVNYSTNHVTYYFYKNEQSNDVRILRAESGCFSSNQKFVSIDTIEKHKKSLEEERDIFIPKLPEDKRQDSIAWCNTKIDSVAKVLTTYEELKNSKTPKPKM